MLQKTLRPLLIASAVFSLGAVQAATDGTLGATSTGTVVISVATASQIQVSGLSDIALALQGSGDVTGDTAACVYRNGAGTYTITATGSGASSAFEISDGGVNTMDYTVTYDDGTGVQALAASTVLAGRSNADLASPTCAGGSNGTIAATVAAADFSGAPAGTYTGTLTLVVAPE